MSAKVYWDDAGMSRVIGRFPDIEKAVTSSKREIDKILDSETIQRNMPEIGDSLNEILRDLGNEKSAAKDLQDALKHIKNCYETSEASLLRVAHATSSPQKGAGSSGKKNPYVERDEKVTAQKEADKRRVDQWIDENPLIPPFAKGALKKASNGLVEFGYGVEQFEKAWENFPSKEEHFARNQYMPVEELPQSPEEAKRMGWNNGVADDCHQFTAGDGHNQKWVSPDGRQEAIYDPDGDLVTDPRDYGTYNFASPTDNGAGHFVDDVLPWIFYGNSEDDSTTPEQRLKAFVVDGGMSAAKKALGMK